MRIRRLIFLLFCMMLLCAPLSSEAGKPLPVALLTGEADLPVRLQLSSPEYRTLSPFDESRLDQLNRLIRHLSLELDLDLNLAAGSLLTDSKTAVSFLQRTSPDGSGEVLWSVEPDTVYRTSAESDAALQDETVRFLEETFLPVNRMLNALYPVFCALPETVGQTKQLDASLSFSGYGRAVKRINMTIPADMAAGNYRDQLASLCADDAVRDMISNLVFSGPQKISLMLDAEGRVLRITYDGTAGFSADDLRKVSAVWKCLRDGEHFRDSLTLKTPSESGDRWNVSMERNLDPTGASGASWDWSFEIDWKTGAVRVPIHFTVHGEKAGESFTGQLTHSVIRDRIKQLLTVSASLDLPEDGTSAGGLEIIHKTGKIEKEHLLLQLAVSPGEHRAWPEEDALHSIDFAPEQDKPFPVPRAVRKQLLRSFLLLPDEDLMYLVSGIPENEWKSILQDTALSVSDEN